jgi:hypothetical protein
MFIAMDSYEPAWSILNLVLSEDVDPCFDESDTDASGSQQRRSGRGKA